MPILRLALIACLIVALICTLATSGAVLDAGMATWLIGAALCWAFEGGVGNRWVIGPPRQSPPP